MENHLEKLTERDKFHIPDRYKKISDGRVTISFYVMVVYLRYRA